jgi:pimeloyl-ACP methyl ester carboxylesterase
MAMIDDARTRLGAMGMAVESQVLLNGFSASGTFANRFTLLHPERVRGVACGGINGVLTLPLASSGGHLLPYPVGIQDVAELTGAGVALEAWKRVPQFVYLGAEDDNDAVAFDDGYSAQERELVHAVLGARMQPDRWAAVQSMYRASGANVRFRTYPGIGHGTNGPIKTEVAEFFRTVMTNSD